MSRQHRLGMVDRGHLAPSTVRQWALLGISRPGLYYRRKEPSEEDLSLTRELDRQYLETPFHGSRRMKAWLEREGTSVNRKRVQRPMQAMGLRSIYRRPKTNRPDPEHRVIPTCWKNRDHQAQPGVGGGHHLRPHGPGIPLPSGRHGLVQPVCGVLEVVQHLRHRFLHGGFGPGAGKGKHRVFNTDQGSQFTSKEFTQALKDQGVRISMDGKGPYADNILVERLWRTVKYEEVYLKAYSGGKEAHAALDA